MICLVGRRPAEKLRQIKESAAQRRFGYTEREAIGRNVRILLPNSDCSRHDGHLARYRSTGERHIIGIGRIVARSAFPMHLSIAQLLQFPRHRRSTGPM